MKTVPMNHGKWFLKSLLLFILLGSAHLHIHAQGEANYWYFGHGVGLNFNGGGPNVLNDGATDVSGGEGEGYATISSPAGALLFYTNGVKVWTRNHVVMPATVGTDLLGHISSAQGAIIVPMPGSANAAGGAYPRYYYIFTVPGEEGSTGTSGSKDPRTGLRYNIVDMDANGGLGNVTTMNVQLTPASTSVMEGLTAVPDDQTGVNQGYWIISHGAGNRTTGAASNAFYVYHVTSGGITPVAAQNAGYAVPGNTTAGVAGSSQSQGMIKSNSCFTSLAVSFHAQGSTVGSVQVFDFDNSNGAVSGPTHTITNFANRSQVYGIEFSPDDQLLYVSELTNNQIQQFDLFPAANVNTAGARFTLVNPAPGGTVNRTGSLQLGPDNKIYVARHRIWGDNSGNSAVGVIADPNNFGAPAYNPTAHAYTVPMHWVTHGLPQFTKSFVSGILKIVNTGAVCDPATLNFSYTFTGIEATTPVRLWNFDDPASGASNTSTSASPSHTFSGPGDYDVTLSVTDKCGRVVTVKKTISILEVMTPVVTVPTNRCANQNIVLTGTGPGNADYQWYNNAGLTSLLGTGTTYTYNGALPKSIWVVYNTPYTSYTGGETYTGTLSSTNTWYQSQTAFTILKSVTLNSVQFRTTASLVYAGCSGNMDVVIKQGATIVKRVNMPAITCGTTYTVALDAVLAAGTYELFLTTPGGTDATDFDIVWKDQPAPITTAGVITVSGSTESVAGTGPFFNFVLSDPYPCKQTLQIDLTANCTLPVEWADFTVAKVAGQAVLSWSTFTELNNRDFVIERSLDGNQFSDIATIAANGNSNHVSFYKHTDREALTGAVYYRIRQVDIDGQFSYSPTRTLDFNASALATVYPNPSAGNFNLQSFVEETLVYTVYDITGRINQTGNASGITSFGADLAPGTYFVKIQSGSEVETIKLVKE